MINNTLIASTKVTTGYVNASIRGITGTLEVNIIPAELDHIEIIPDSVAVVSGESQVFNAIGFDRFNNTLEIDPIWSTDVGVMEGNKLISQNFGGQGIVSASVGEIVGIANVIVEYNSSLHHPPVIVSTIPNQVMQEDSEPIALDLATYEYDLEDSNKDLIWYITDNDKNMYTTTGSYSDVDIITIIPKPDAFGSDRATLWLVDSDNMTASQNLWINITPVNDKPVIEKIPDIYIHYSEPYTFDYSNYIWDIESPNSELELTIVEPPGQKYSTVNGLNVTYDYPQSMFGEKIILTLSVSDGEATTERTFNIEITDNHAPKLIKPFPNVVIQEGETKNFILNLDDYFSDQDNDKLTFFFNAQFVAIILHENNSISISSIGTWWGVDSIKFRAVDPYGAISEGILRITVIQVNDPPIILQIPDIYLHYEYDYQLNLTKYISDPDNDTGDLTLWSNYPEFIRFPDKKNSIMILNFPESFLGIKIPIILNVSDDLAMVWCKFNIYITDNFPPKFKNNLFDVYFDEDTTLSDAFNLDDHFEDKDDDQLVYSINVLDSDNVSVTINPDNTVSFSSKENWCGETQIFIQATDHADAFVEIGLNVIVIPINDPPIIQEVPIQKGYVGERWVLDLSSYISDVDNNLKELNIEVNSDFVTMTGTHLTFYAYKETETEFEVTISDGYLNTTRIVELEISESPNPQTEELLQMVWLLILLMVCIVFSITFVIYRSQKGNFTITDVFLIHKSGILIKYKGDTLKEGKDEDIIGSMLTAVQTFITDSFADGNSGVKDDWRLNQIRLGKHELFIERGENIFIAVIYKGRPGKKLPNKLKDTIFDIELKYGKSLYNWSGNYRHLKGIEDLIEPIISSPINNNEKPKTDFIKEKQPI
jgi:hypothetical protein